MRQIILIVHDVRSTHNVGSLLRTADGLGVSKIYMSGYSPYPAGGAHDPRLPHEAQKLHKQISKTALGAEASMPWQHVDDILGLIEELKVAGWCVVAIEQSPEATLLTTYKPADKLVLIVGREVEGIEPEVLAVADDIVEIPMLGAKESFNVAIAAAIVLYHCQYFCST